LHELFPNTHKNPQSTIGHLSISHSQRSPSQTFYKGGLTFLCLPCAIFSSPPPSFILHPTSLVFRSRITYIAQGSHNDNYVVFQDQYIEIRGHTLQIHNERTIPQRYKAGQRKTKYNYPLCGLVFAATHFALRARTHTHTRTQLSSYASLPTRAHSLLAHSHAHVTQGFVYLQSLKHGSVRRASQLTIFALYRAFTLTIIQIPRPRWQPFRWRAATLR
jgi:hypothetical protein